MEFQCIVQSQPTGQSIVSGTVLLIDLPVPTIWILIPEFCKHFLNFWTWHVCLSFTYFYPKLMILKDF